MQLTGESQTLELRSNSDSLSKVERLIEDIRNKYNVSEDIFGNMLVAITEAVTNAIYHGNKSDPNKKVSVSCTHSPHSIMFTVADEGKGFDFYNLPDPTSPENLEKECGRGIFLMKHLADQLIFSENGRVVELNFKISGN
jgi:serine/threonine-protein kinase RsbW